MNTTKLLCIASAMVFLFTNCTNTAADKALNTPESRAATISGLLSNHDCRSQLIDSLSTGNHAEVMQEMVQNKGIMSKMMQTGGMMENMMQMCDIDSSICNKMCGTMMSDEKGSKCMMMKMHEKGMMKMDGMDKSMKMPAGNDKKKHASGHSHNH